MGFADIIVMASIICGSVYLLYRSIWKKKGHCPGCDAGCSNPGRVAPKRVQFNQRK